MGKTLKKKKREREKAAPVSSRPFIRHELNKSIFVTVNNFVFNSTSLSIFFGI